MANDVEIKDLGIGKLRRMLETLHKQSITAGIQGTSGAAPHPNANDATVADVALWMEFGTPGSDDRQYDQQRSLIPPRPFLRTAARNEEADLTKAIRRGISDIIDQRAGLEEVQVRLGNQMAVGIRRAIDTASEWAEPLAASTIKAKGHARPLVETGTLRDSVSWAIRDQDTILKQGGEKK